MTVELLKDLKTKQYIIEDLKKENYINNVTCAKGNKFYMESKIFQTS